MLLHATMKHENIVQLKDIVKGMVMEHRTPMFIMVMEHMRGGELFAEVVDNGGLPLDDREDDKGKRLPGARTYARQILLGLAYCHNRSIAHRDIKLENLLLTEDRQTCKVADFGLAKISTGDADGTILGTIRCVSCLGLAALPRSCCNFRAHVFRVVSPTLMRKSLMPTANPYY